MGFCKCSLDKKSDEPALKLAKQIGIDLNLIGDNGGFYLIDFSKKSNYQSLSRNHKLNLDNQIDTLMKIDSNFYIQIIQDYLKQ